MTNTYILNGTSKADDILSSTANGVFVTSLGGGQTNPATGDFVFGVRRGVPDRGRRGRRRPSAART